MRYKILILCILGLVFHYCSEVKAQVDPDIDARLERRWHPFQDADWPYRLFVPDDYSPAQAYPLILFLHGAMWRGTDNVTHLDNELAVFWVKETVQSIQPCFVLLPQCPVTQTWEVVSGQVETFPPAPMLDMVLDLLDSLEQEFSIDPDRISCVGKSIGGQGVYGLISRHPDRFAACMPVAGMPVYQDISRISQIPLWIHHAKDDPSVSINLSLDVVRLLEQEGSPFIYTHCDASLNDCDPITPDSMDQVIDSGASHIISIYDTATHQIESNVVRTYGLAEWLLSRTRNQTDVPSIQSSKDLTVVANYPNPFNASTVIRYHLEKSTIVRIQITDMLGRRVRNILSRDQDRGAHVIRWDGRDAAGNPLATGVYFCRIQSNQTAIIHKLLLLR